MDLSRKLSAEGHELVETGADVAIINTCSVTKTAIRKDRRMVNKAKAENPKAKIVVMGCWPAVYGKDIVSADTVWGAGKLDELVKQISNFQFPIKVPSPNNIPNSQLQKSRYFLKVQDGCEQYCTYCVIPYARGKLKSRPANEILDEARKAVKQGYREIVLCGIHLGLYGAEARSRKLEARKSISMQKCDLTSLLKSLIIINGLGRIRLSSIEVNEVTDDLVELLAESVKLCRHLHIPLQSGSDKILKLMNRPYNSEQFMEKAGQIRKNIPDIALTTDVIVGFPGETESDFKDTYNLIKSVGFSRLHVFPFSPHEKVPAYKLPKRIEAETIKKRTRKLKNLGSELENGYRKKFKGRELEAIIEHNNDSKFIAKTEYYFDVEPNKESLAKQANGGKKIRAGSLIKIKIQ